MANFMGPNAQGSSCLRSGQRFKHRFRYPSPVFRDVLVPLCNAANVFESRHNGYVPIEFKVLISLRVLVVMSVTTVQNFLTSALPRAKISLKILFAIFLALFIVLMFRCRKMLSACLVS